MSQAEDIDAIIVYMAQQTPKTALAKHLKADWLAWLNDLGWYDKNYNQVTYDTARNKRNAFNLANAANAQELENVKAVIKGGLTTEQMQGIPDRRDAEGMFQVPPPSGKPVWPYVALGTVLLASFGYVLASAARLGGR